MILQFKRQPLRSYLNSRLNVEIAKLWSITLNIPSINMIHTLKNQLILHFFEGLKRFQLFDVKIPCFILLPFDIIILTDDFITEIKEYENIFSIIIRKICKIGLRKKEYTIDLMKITRKLTLTWISKNQICLVKQLLIFSLVNQTFV